MLCYCHFILVVSQHGWWSLSLNTLSLFYVRGLRFIDVSLLLLYIKNKNLFLWTEYECGVVDVPPGCETFTPPPGFGSEADGPGVACDGGVLQRAVCLPPRAQEQQGGPTPLHRDPQVLVSGFPLCSQLGSQLALWAWVQFSSVQNGIYELRSAHMHSTLHHRSFPNVCCLWNTRIVPMFVWLMTALLSFQGRLPSASSIHASLVLDWTLKSKISLIGCTDF